MAIQMVFGVISEDEVILKFCNISWRFGNVSGVSEGSLFHRRYQIWPSGLKQLSHNTLLQA